MENRRLGQSDVTVSPVILGAWAMGGWFWGGSDDDAAVATIHAALDAGVTAIDTAPVYGRGRSESVVGRALRERPGHGVAVLTKLGLRWNDRRGAHYFSSRDPGGEFDIYRNLRPDSIAHEIDASLERLGVEVIDLIQCHWPDPTTPVEESMGALTRAVEQGKVRAIGVSNFAPELLERAHATLAAAGLPLASEQPPYSLLRQDIDETVLPWCRRHDVGVIPYSPMERGLLTGKIGPDRVFPESDGRSTDPLFRPHARAVVLAALEDFRHLLTEHDCTMGQLALAWVLHRPGITAVLAGARTPKQVRENVGAARVSLSDDDVRRMGLRFRGIRRELRRQ